MEWSWASASDPERRGGKDQRRRGARGSPRRRHAAVGYVVLEVHRTQAGGEPGLGAGALLDEELRQGPGRERQLLECANDPRRVDGAGDWAVFVEDVRTLMVGRGRRLLHVMVPSGFGEAEATTLARHALGRLP